MSKKIMNSEGNEVIILKGPMTFNPEIRKEMELNWSRYAGLEIDDPEVVEGNWYYTEVVKVVYGPNNIGYKVWNHEDELSGLN